MISIASPASTAAFGSLAGADQSNDLKRQVGRKVGGAAGKSIAGGAGKRRLIPVGKNRFGQHPAQSIEQGSRLRRAPRRSGQPLGMLPDDPAGVRIADHPGWSGIVQEIGAKRREGRRSVPPLSAIEA